MKRQPHWRLVDPVVPSPSSSVYFSAPDTLLSLQFHPSVSCQLASVEIPFAFPPNILL